jgi:glycosyltransferase involved in cell wall biosynthesis
VKLVIIVPWGARLGGAEQMLWDILQNLDRQRVTAVVVFMEDGPFRHEVDGLGFPTAVLGATQLRDARNFARVVARLVALLRRERPQLVLSWMAKAHLYAGPAAALSGLRRRCVWWQHLVPRDHWMDRAATALPAVAVGASSITSADAQRQIRPVRRTFVVSPGVDVERYGTASESAPSVRQRCGLSPASFVAVIVGRLQPWKGQQVLLRSIAQLRHDGVDASALVVGGEAFGESAGFARALRDLAASLEISAFVHFTGHVADPGPYLHAADVFVNASDGEPFGIVLLEAMAAGLPVVAVDRAGPREFIDAGSTGLLIGEASPQALADAIAELARDPSRARALGRAAQAEVAARYSTTRMAEEFMAEMESLC